jgi:AcrR family transcriptional regulator
MEPKPRSVNQKRRYDSGRRREQARQTREAILETARRLFLLDGFSQTTVAAIAVNVGVSVDTIYKSFGGKSGLVQAICDEALGGEGPIRAETRSDALQAEESDPRKIIRGWGKLTMEVSPRVSPILLLVRDAAANDPEMATLRVDLDARRLERMTQNARNLAKAGHLRRDLDIGRAGEILWTYSSPELYELLVLNRHWSLEQYGTFVADALIAAVLRPQTSDVRSTRWS